LLLLLVALSLGCGHRAPLIPPLPRVPKTPAEVQVRQRGDQLEVRARYAMQLLTDRPLVAPIESVLLASAVSDPAAAAGLIGDRTDRAFEASSREHRLAVLTAPADRERREDRIALARLGRSPAYVLAVALKDKRNRSRPSRRLVFVPQHEPLPAPLEVAVEPLEQGVVVRWTLVEDARVRRVHVYRRVAGQAESWEPWRALDASARELIDTTATYGNQLEYIVATAAETAQVAVESPIRTSGLITYRDTFPPRRPTSLEALLENQSVRVLWFPGGSADESQVRIEREGESEPGFSSIGTAAAADAYFIDKSPPRAGRFRYRVIGIDVAGNAAEPTEPTPWLTFDGEEPE
jgi:hypothetical protein